MKSILIALIGLSLTGCSVMIGNIRPVEEKSSRYQVLDLSLAKKGKTSEWIRLGSLGDPQDRSSATPTSSTPGPSADDAFQNIKTSAIISINSVCKRVPRDAAHPTLQQLTHELLLGMSDVRFTEEKDRVVAGVVALETTLKGKMNQREIIVRSVVLDQDRCVYDMMYITEPKYFNNHLKTFEEFVSSLRVGP